MTRPSPADPQGNERGALTPDPTLRSRRVFVFRRRVVTICDTFRNRYEHRSCRVEQVLGQELHDDDIVL